MRQARANFDLLTKGSTLDTRGEGWVLVAVIGLGVAGIMRIFTRGCATTR